MAVRLRVLATLLVAGSLSAAVGPSAPTDSWPAQFRTAGGSLVVVYQPQVETFRGDEISGHTAVAVTKDATTRFGVVSFTGRISVDRDTRMVSILDVRVDRVRFPGITPEREEKFAALLQHEMPQWQLTVSYDRLLENLRIAEKERKCAEEIRNEPPRIVFREEPAVLVTIDGEPQLRDVEGAPLKVVVNTPFFIVLDAESRHYFLSGGDHWWYRADDPRGPWQPVAAPPPRVAALAKSGDHPADGTESASPPNVLVATEPTELIVSEGKPSFQPVDGLDLLWMSNTESDILLDLPSREYYVLLSGRWFKSRSLTEDGWTFVPPGALPNAFSRIPADSEIGRVRASVPGTAEAEDAALDAQIPQIARIQRSQSRLEVRYDGEPKFAPIEGTDMEYAVNASTAVLEIRGRYYACDDAVWFIADSPWGPWRLADSIPRDELDQIPPSSPVYSVKFVDIYASGPETVEFGYTPGYLGCLVWDGMIVWGTGWNYPPWIGSVYWPWPYTWGFCARYDAFYGWYFGYSWSYPFFDAGFYWDGWLWRSGWGWDHGRRGGRHRGWWGPGGYRRHVVGVEAPNRPGVAGRGANGVGFRPPAARLEPRAGVKLYGRPPGSAGVRPRPTVPRVTPRPARPPNNVYGGKDGNVYRRTDDGQWQRREGTAWKPAAPTPPVTVPVQPKSPRPDLDREFGARQRGEARSRGTAAAPAAPRPSAPPRPSPPPKR